MVTKYKKIYIQWRDSWSIHAQIWLDIDQLLESDKEYLCETTSFLIDEDDYWVHTASTVDGDRCSGHISIPKIAILKRRYLK